MEVVWSKQAEESLSKIYFYIFGDSPQNAIMVLDKIIEQVEKLSDERFEFSIDPL